MQNKQPKKPILPNTPEYKQAMEEVIKEFREWDNRNKKPRVKDVLDNLFKNN